MKKLEVRSKDTDSSGSATPPSPFVDIWTFYIRTWFEDWSFVIRTSLTPIRSEWLSLAHRVNESLTTGL